MSWFLRGARAQCAGLLHPVCHASCEVGSRVEHDNSGQVLRTQDKTRSSLGVLNIHPLALPCFIFAARRSLHEQVKASAAKCNSQAKSPSRSEVCQSDSFCGRWFVQSLAQPIFAEFCRMLVHLGRRCPWSWCLLWLTTGWLDRVGRSESKGLSPTCRKATSYRPSWRGPFRNALTYLLLFAQLTGNWADRWCLRFRCWPPYR